MEENKKASPRDLTYSLFPAPIDKTVYLGDTSGSSKEPKSSKSKSRKSHKQTKQPRLKDDSSSKPDSLEQSNEKDCLPSEVTKEPGKKRKRHSSPEVIPNPPGVSYGMDLRYFIYSSDDSDDSDGPDEPNEGSYPSRPKKVPTTPARGILQSGRPPLKRVRFDTSPDDTPSKLRARATDTYTGRHFVGVNDHFASQDHITATSMKAPPPLITEEFSDRPSTFIPNPHGTFTLDYDAFSSDSETELSDTTIPKKSATPTSDSLMSEKPKAKLQATCTDESEDEYETLDLIEMSPISKTLSSEDPPFRVPAHKSSSQEYQADSSSPCISRTASISYSENRLQSTPSALAQISSDLPTPDTATDNEHRADQRSPDITSTHSFTPNAQSSVPLPMSAHNSHPSSTSATEAENEHCSEEVPSGIVSTPPSTSVTQDQHPPHCTTPSHPSLPPTSSADDLGAVAKVRSQVEKYKPKTPSGLRASSRFCSPLADSPNPAATLPDQEQLTALFGDDEAGRDALWLYNNCPTGDFSQLQWPEPESYCDSLGIDPEAEVLLNRVWNQDEVDAGYASFVRSLEESEQAF
jgi:hypothetical protein